MMTGAMTLWSFLHLLPSNVHPPLANQKQKECRETPLVRMLQPDTEGPQGFQLQVSDGLCCHWWRDVPKREDVEHLAFWGLEEEPGNEFKNSVSECQNITRLEIKLYEQCC